MVFINKKCYFCGEPATSKEHAPPQQMFKVFECDSITVPSCYNHNIKKGKNDQAIVSALMIPLYNIMESKQLNRYQFEPNVISAINARGSAFERVKHKAKSRQLPKTKRLSLSKVAYVTPEVNVCGWIKQLTAALVWDVIHEWDNSIDWENTKIDSPDYISTRNLKSIPLKKIIQKQKKAIGRDQNYEELHWRNGWSAHPRPYPSDIYSFKVYIGEYIWFRHLFYNRYKWYVWFKASEDICDAFFNKIC